MRAITLAKYFAISFLVLFFLAGMYTKLREGFWFAPLTYDFDIVNRSFDYGYRCKSEGFEYAQCHAKFLMILHTNR